MIEKTLEKFLFASRWLLAPFYVALVLALALLMVKTLQEVWHFILHIPEAKEAEVILAALSLIDLTFTGSLIVIVIFFLLTPTHIAATVTNIPRLPKHTATMSFETTATIANFGGKLLKLAHQVNIHRNGYSSSCQVLTHEFHSQKPPPPR